MKSLQQYHCKIVATQDTTMLLKFYAVLRFIISAFCFPYYPIFGPTQQTGAVLQTGVMPQAIMGQVLNE